jgi:hypothetical protein
VGVVLSRPPQVHSLGRAEGGDSVGLDQGAVDVHVAVAGGLGRQQRAVQVRRLRGKHVDALMKALVGGGFADRVVDPQLPHPGGVAQPADHQHRLFEAAQGTGAAAGARRRRLA